MKTKFLESRIFINFAILDLEQMKAEIELLKTQLKQGEETNKTLGKV